MTLIIVVVLAGILGLAIGSFLNVCIDRLPQGRSIAAVPSHCESCGHRLTPVEMVPVFSYMWLQGRCRDCRDPIPLRLPLVELATAVLFGYVAFRYGVAVQAVVVAAFVSILIVVFVVDLQWSLILNKVVYPGIAFAFLVAPWGPAGHGLPVPTAYVEALKGVLLGGVVPLAIYLLARGGFGAGDVKLGAMLGLMMGLVPVLVALQLSFLVGGVVAILLLAFKVRRRGDLIPFGPFLAGAGVVGLFWGQNVFHWYQSLFF